MAALAVCPRSYDVLRGFFDFCRAGRPIQLLAFWQYHQDRLSPSLSLSLFALCHALFPWGLRTPLQRRSGPAGLCSVGHRFAPLFPIISPRALTGGDLLRNSFLVYFCFLCEVRLLARRLGGRPAFSHPRLALSDFGYRTSSREASNRKRTIP